MDDGCQSRDAEERHGNAIYFTSLQVENVRAFGTLQRFDLTDAAGAPASWTLIVGENGTGKTTLLQCLARMQPFPQWKRGDNGKFEVDLTAIDKAPDYIEPELLQFENSDLVMLLRDGRSSADTTIRATLVSGAGLDESLGTSRRALEIGATLASVEGKPETVKTQQQAFSLPDPGPLVIGYGAARRVGHLTRSRVQSEHPLSSLFRDATDLYDAEEILRDAHLAVAFPIDPTPQNQVAPLLLETTVVDERRGDRERVHAVQELPMRALAEMLVADDELQFVQDLLC